MAKKFVDVALVKSPFTEKILVLVALVEVLLVEVSPWKFPLAAPKLLV